MHGDVDDERDDDEPGAPARLATCRSGLETVLNSFERAELALVEQQRRRVGVDLVADVLELLDPAHHEVVVAGVDDALDRAVHPGDRPVEHAASR